MSRYVISCVVMMCDVMLCYTVRRHGMVWYAMGRYVMLWYDTVCDVMRCDVMVRSVCSVLLYQALRNNFALICYARLWCGHLYDAVS